MRNKLSIVLAATIALIASGCTSRLTDFTVISTKNVPIGNQTTNLVKADKRVVGVDRAHFILFIPTGTPNLKEAIDKAIEQYPGAIALADGVVKSKFMDFLFYGQSSYIVEGTPLYPANMQQNNYGNNGYNQNNSYNRQNSYSNQNSYNNQNSCSNQNNGNDNNYMRITHEVDAEKNISELAKMYEVSIPDIMKWNNLSSTMLTKGQKVTIYIQR